MALILVVDDERVLRSNLERYLNALGHDVRTAANGREAIAAIEESEPDLLVTDINMPDMDGIEMLNALRKSEVRLPVIAMSGGGQFDKRLLLGSAAVLGALVTLEKPFDLAELKRAIEELLAP
jgi:CheY-like chemotaxis protein